MAGHRRGTGRPTRDASRVQAHRERLAGATCAEDQLGAAYDWFRSAVRRHGGAGEIAEAARYLATEADKLERSAA
jgi:hypothetical protein